MTLAYTNYVFVLYFSGVGYGQAIATASVVSYYTVLIALAVFYLVASCQSTLPWTVCDSDLQLDNGTVCIGKKHALKKYDHFAAFGSNITPVVQFHEIFVTIIMYFFY